MLFLIPSLIGLLLNSLYIGERNRLNQIELRTRELPADPTQAQIEEAAERAGPGVTPADISRRKGQLEEPPEQFVSSGTFRTVVESGRFTETGDPIYRVATKAERQAPILTNQARTIEVTQLSKEEDVEILMAAERAKRIEETTAKLERKRRERVRRDFITQAERPFGAAQRADISEIKAQQQIAKAAEIQRIARAFPPTEPAARFGTITAPKTILAVEELKSMARAEAIKRQPKLIIEAAPREKGEIRLLKDIEKSFRESAFAARPPEEGGRGSILGEKAGFFVARGVATISTKERLKARGTAAALGIGAGFALSALALPAAVGVGVLGIGTVEEITRFQKISKIADPGQRQRIFDIELVDIGLSLGGGLIGAKAGQAIRPKTAEVTRIVSRKVALQEQVDIERGRGIERVLADIEKKTFKTEAKVKAFERRVQAPQDPEAFAEFISREDIRFGFGLDETGQIKETFFLQEAPKVRKFVRKPEPFKIEGRGITAVEVARDGERVSIIKEVPDFEKVIDPTKFKIIRKGGETLLQRKTKFPPVRDVLKRFELFISGEVPEILSKIKRKVGSEIFGVDAALVPPQEISVLVPKPSTGPPIVSVALPPKSLGFFLAGQQELEIEIEKDLDITQPKQIQGLFLDVEQEQEQEAILKPVQDIIQEPVLEVRQETRPRGVLDFVIDLDVSEQRIPEPVLIVVPEQEQEQEPIIVPVVDVRVEEEEELKVVRPGPEIPSMFDLPRFEDVDRRRPKQFKGFNASAKQGKKFVRLNTRPMTKRAAEDLATEVVDNTISARGKVTQIKKPLKKRPQDGGTGFAVANRFKFRGFTTDRQGRKKADLPEGEFIERRKFRLDRPMERQTIQQFKKRAAARPKNPFGNINL